jgi:hypothetical protein
MMTIALSGKKAAGRVALVDDEDYDLISPHRWRVWERKDSRRLHGPYAYTTLSVAGSPVDTFMHKLITGWPLTDHKNHDGLDNQRANLRPATSAQSQQNRRPVLGSSSKYKGVHWYRQSRKWRAKIQVNGVSYYLGLHASEEEAALAYNAAALQAFGTYAYLNQIDTAA